MTLPTVIPNFIFGLKSDIRGNAHYLKDNEVLYPVGAVVAVHNFQTNRQKYIKLPEKCRTITVMCLSHNKKMLAVAEKGDPPSVSLYDLSKLERSKVWSVSRTESPSAVEFVSISFSHDGKLVAGITGQPDWLLLCYSIEKGRVDSIGKAQNPVNPGPLLQVTFSPEDSSMVCIGGPGCLRFLQYTETMWNQVGFSKSEFLQITTFCWLSQYKVLAGTRDGRLIVLEDGDLRATHFVKDVTYLNIRERVIAPEDSEVRNTSTLEDAVQAALEPFGSKPGKMELNAMISFGKGFAFSYGFGFIYVFWRESDTRYRRSHVFKIPNYSDSVDLALEDSNEAEVVPKEPSESVHSSSELAIPSEKSLISPGSDVMDMVSLGNVSMASGPQTVEDASGTRKDSSSLTSMALDAVRQICVNVAETELIATSGRSQLYYTQLWIADERQERITMLQHMGENLHHGPVSGLAVCMLKPIFVTCGAFDKTVRLWNYETATLELLKYFEDDLFCIDLHPTGLHVVIGFSDKLRFMNVLIDDLKEVREISIRKCNECAFSSSGHLFAATYSSNINIYSTLTFDLLYSFKGHKKRILSLSWTSSDYQLVSCGIFGNVYEWDLPSKKRIAETVSLTKPFTYAVITSNGNATYASGLDGRLCELSQSKVLQTYKWEDKKLNMVMKAHSDKMIFVSDSNGTLISIALPLTDHSQWEPLDMHNELIVKMKMSYNDRHIITASEDGSICIWKVDAKVTGLIKLGTDVIESKDILIGKEDLQNKVELIQELTARVNHLELEHAFKMKEAQDQHSEKLQKIQDSYYKELEDIKKLNEAMETKHANEISILNENVEKLKLNFETGVHNMESEYNDKLIIEYDKYEKLEELHQQLKNDCEMKFIEMTKEKEKALQDLNEEHDEQLNQKIIEIAELNKQALCREREHEEITAQIEDDVDREMIELKAKYELLLKEEHDTNMRLRGEVGAMKKRLLSSQKEIDEFIHQVQTLQSEQLKYKQAIHGLEKDITDLKKEIQERDTSVHLKEKRIYELKRKNQELEKYKYVLNFKITELKNQKEPREREIKEKKEQIQDMEKELGILQTRNETFELKMKYYNDKLSGMETELRNQRIHAHNLNTFCQRMQCDIYNASGFIQNPKKLKESVKQLNMKYNKDKAVVKTKEEDVGASVEFQRQREHLERTIATLRSQLQKETERSKKDHFRLVGENSALITEMNKMQFELKAAMKHIQDIETMVGLTGKSESINEAQMKFKAALMSNEEIHESYAKRIEHLEQIVEVQKEEMDRMTSKLSSFEQATAKAGTSQSS
ncbi:cilia- and flagella-associated protein 57 [Hetaerina americana]|uniref:cilia- and flagella-associated protein 57 n=1 Tax=Hetaerina americana TaxID=62018 RepID=UPI003A7F3C63